MWDTRHVYTRIKLCWFEHLEAAYEASDLGADALGFHLRQISGNDWRARAQHFREILDVLPPTIEKTVLTDFPFEVVNEILAIAPFNSVQLYPDWEPADINRLRKGHRVRVLKVMSAQTNENNPADDGEFLRKYASSVDAILFDSSRKGGTGQLANLGHSVAVVRASSVPVFIAGGLTSTNVRERIRAIRPFGVDVESGVSVKLPNGWVLKNLRRCREFVDEVVRTDRELLRDCR